MNRSEVKTLLAEAAGGTSDKIVEEKSPKDIPSPSPVNTEPDIQGSEEVVEQSSIILDPSLIPDGEGMVHG